jgi:hypothetical protein
MARSEKAVEKPFATPVSTATRGLSSRRIE